ncbi:MAG: transcriptional repressor [Alphaproteobacteria bacterium]|nr:transcriptional repressor [Alphaproteobacteria bacterium]
MASQHFIVTQVLLTSENYSNIKEVHKRTQQVDPKISPTTIYLTLRLFQEEHILKQHAFGDRVACYENASVEHHHHLIDKVQDRLLSFMMIDQSPSAGDSEELKIWTCRSSV